MRVSGNSEGKLITKAALQYWPATKTHKNNNEKNIYKMRKKLEYSTLTAWGKKSDLHPTILKRNEPLGTNLSTNNQWKMEEQTELKNGDKRKEMKPSSDKT